MPALNNLVVLTLALLSNLIVSSAINPSYKLKVRGPVRTRHNIINVERKSNAILALRGGSSLHSSNDTTPASMKVFLPSSKRRSGYVLIIGMLSGMLIREAEFASRKGNKMADTAICLYQKIPGALYFVIAISIHSLIFDWGRFNRFKHMLPPIKLYGDLIIGHFAGKNIGVKSGQIPDSIQNWERKKYVAHLAEEDTQRKFTENLCLLIGGLGGPVLILYLMIDNVRDLAMALAPMYFGVKILYDLLV